MLKGFANRKIGGHKANTRSSRSHTVIQIFMERKDLIEGSTINSTMNLIDLAGAERIADTGADKDPERLAEAKMINYSLSQLGNVMNALVKRMNNSKTVVPFRNSQLTFLLKDALSSNCAVTLNCNMSCRRE